MIVCAPLKNFGLAGGRKVSFLFQPDPHDIFLPRQDGRGESPAGGAAGPRRDNVREVPAEDIRRLDLDCVVFCRRRPYEEDQFQLLSPEQRRLPKILVEPDPPTDTTEGARHPVDDPDTLLIHMTPFNQLMWDSGRTPSRVIEYGVEVPGPVSYRGELDRGISVIDRLAQRRFGIERFVREWNEALAYVTGFNLRRNLQVLPLSGGTLLLPSSC
jgi:hypothetical protein